jgi:5-methylcytosine-specific restriction protein A
MPKRIPTFRPSWLRNRESSRPNSTQRGYGSAAWRRIRLLVIARDQGMCRRCGRLIIEPREGHVDHIDPKPTLEAAENTPLDGLQLLCASCHSLKHRLS